MLSLAAAVLAAAVWCWPVGSGRGRLNQLRRWEEVSQRGPQEGSSAWRWIGQHPAVLLGVLSAGLGTLLAGPAGGLAAAMVIGTVTACWRAGRKRRAGTAAAAGLSEALEVLAAELRAGAHPGGAIMAAATDGHPEARRALSEAAAVARLGGDVPAVLRAVGTVALRPWLSRLAHAWSLAERHGTPLADLLDAVHTDLEQRLRFAAEVDARLAGPRATAAVLAGLPLLGLALGQAVGAAPLQVLGGTTAGQALLVVGTALACSGMLWSARLTAGVVPR